MRAIEPVASFVMIALILVTTCSASAFQGGDRVLAQFLGSKFWFAGVVESANGNLVTVLYDDGLREIRPENQVKTYDWTVGSRVECRFMGGRRWYPGEISRIGGGISVQIKYNDGDVENTSTARGRSR